MNETKQFFDHLLCKNENDEGSGDEDWSESSYNSSCYSDSDSSIPDWDSSVDEKTGQVLYIECHPFVTQNIRYDKKDKEKIFSRNQNRRSTRGKFLQLLRRKEIKRSSKRNIKILDSESHNTNKVKFQDFQEGEEREVTLKILNEHIVRGDNLVETFLGIHVSTLSDGMRLMVAGFLHDSYAKYERNIKIGDWLKSINGLEVNLQNINTVLQQLSGKNEVLIKLQRVAGVEVTKDPPMNVLNNQSAFVKQLTSFTTEEDENLQELCKLPLGFAYLATDKLDEMGTEYKDIIYCYPRPVQKNALCNSKGVFLTLSHLLQDITKSATKLTSLFFDKVLCHITYVQFEKNLFLLMLPEICAKPEELQAIAVELSRMLIFTYDTLENCFKNEEIQHVDHIFSMFFKRMINGGLWAGELKLQDNISGIPTSDYVFEDILPAVGTLNLPNEAVIQIEDALTELEACDYREWNEEPLDCQRIFTVLGSAWYHSGYLLASHLTDEDLVDIHFFCKYQGILHLSKTEPVKTLILWRECFPTSCRALIVPIFKLPEARRYLLIVGSGKDLLVVIMEAGGSTEFPEANAAPDPFYVEEAQATLAHLQELGLPELADRFIEMNPGPQVTIPVAPNNKKKLDVLSFTMSAKQAPFRDANSATKKPEVTSILKRRSNDQSQTIYTSTYSLSEDTYDVHSEDSGSQGCGSELSDDPVAGRNGDKKNKYDSASDESGNEGNCDGSQMSTNSFDITEIKQMLLTETEDVRPIQIASGTINVLYHYVQFDKLEGILLSPPECKIRSPVKESVISNFRRCCQHIHRIFQNTIRFKMEYVDENILTYVQHLIALQSNVEWIINPFDESGVENDMSSQEMSKSMINKSLIAIKEYGAMFECSVLEDKDFKKNKILYWVVGRLFFNPHIREMYVCYNDTIPQNMIELAFKLNMGFCESRQ